MHALHVLDHSLPLQSGYTFRTRAILREQRALGWKTTQVTSPKHNQGKLLPALEHIDHLDFYRSPELKNLCSRFPLLDQWSVIQGLTKRLIEVSTEVKPDILHAHSPALNGVAAIRTGKKLGIPVVYEVRGFWEDAAVSHGTSRAGGLRYHLGRAMETWVLKRADEITCICDGIRQDLVLRGIAAEKITLVPNAVDVDRFQPIIKPDDALQRKLGLKGKKVIAFIGSFYDYEGLDLLVESMPKLLSERPDIRLLLVGGGDVAQAIKTQVANLGIESKVVITGRVPYDEVHSYYSITDVLVYPRKSMRLTELVTPLKPLEAMAQKSIFVASDVGGHRELIRDGVTGTLFKADDTDNLVEVLLRLLNQEDSWPRIRDAGRNFVENERNWASSVANVRSVYQRLMQGEKR